MQEVKIKSKKPKKMLILMRTEKNIDSIHFFSLNLPIIKESLQIKKKK